MSLYYILRMNINKYIVKMNKNATDLSKRSTLGEEGNTTILISDEGREIMNKHFTKRVILTLIGCFLMQSILGAQYVWGNILPYCSGYYRLNMGTNVTMAQFYTVFPIIMIVSTVLFPVGMKLAGVYGPKALMTLGACLMVVSIYTASLMDNPFFFYLIFAVGFGLGKGLVYPSSFKVGWMVLPGRKGFVSGVVVSGLSLGAFFYGILANKLVNPDNLSAAPIQVEDNVIEYYFPQEVNSRVPSMLAVLSLLWLTISVISIAMV